MSIASLSLLLAAAQYAPMQPITQPLTLLSGTVSGDFDGDGDVDLIALDRVDDGSMFFEAVAPGEFAAPRPILFGGATVRGAVSGDLNGDGHLDLVIVTRPLDERLLYVEGRGDGTFEVPVALGPGFSMNGTPRLVDLNQNGRLDILATGRGPFGLRATLYQNLGAGRFAPPRQLSPDASTDAQALDVDSDGDLDILLASEAGPLQVLFNDGTEQFQFGGSLAFFTGTDQLELLDLDGDGDQDVIAKANSGSVLFALENLGGGAFGPRQDYDASTLGISRFALVDVDRDGREDVVTFSNNARPPVWMRNEVGFPLGAAQTLSSTVTLPARLVEAVDLNADGILDFAIGSGGETVQTLLSDASLGTMPYGPSTELLTPVPGMNDVAAIDIDADGDLDLVSVASSGELYVAIGRGFTQRDVPVPLGLIAANTLEAADLDGDGDLDIVAMDSQRRAVLFENSGTGTLTERVLTPGAMTLSQRFELQDLNGDGLLDILAIGDGSEVVVVTQIGGGVFSPPTSVASFSLVVRRTMAADVNQDGRLDISVVLEDINSSVPNRRRIVWLEGLAAGGFLPPELLVPDLESMIRPLPFQLNSQGYVEFLWMSRLGAQSLLASSSAPAAYTILDLGVDPGGPDARFGIGDLRGNGLGDLVVAGGTDESTSLQTVRAYSRNGSSFSQLEGVLTTAVRDVRAIRFVDLDGDRDEDILLAGSGAPQLAWIENLRRDTIGVNFCGPAVQNSQGLSASMSAVGSDSATSNDLTLRAADLTPSSTGLFLVSQTQDFFPSVPGSSGALCLGGAIGRYQGAGQIQTVSADGTIRLDVDLSAIPQPGGAVPATAGTLWLFQAWYRDSAAGQPTSNFTDGLAVVFI